MKTTLTETMVKKWQQLAYDVTHETLHGPLPMKTIAELADAVALLAKDWLQTSGSESKPSTANPTKLFDAMKVKVILKNGGGSIVGWVKTPDPESFGELPEGQTKGSKDNDPMWLFAMAVIELAADREDIYLTTNAKCDLMESWIRVDEIAAIKMVEVKLYKDSDLE